MGANQLSLSQTQAELLKGVVQQGVIYLLRGLEHEITQNLPIYNERSLFIQRADGLTCGNRYARSIDGKGGIR